jgi:AcrR family transcriptional regulator
MKAGAVRPSSQGKIAHPQVARDPSARDRRSSRWDEHRRTRREQLVDAAVAAVGRHGAGVGMEEIAAAAGTSKTVVYRHFADRRDLHLAVCSRVAGQLLAKLRDAMASSDEPRQMVAAAIDTYLAFLDADPELYRFVVHSQTAEADPIAGLSHLVGREAAGLLGLALRQAGRDEAPAEPWGHGIVGLVRAAADWWLAAERPMIRSVLAAHLTELAWSGLSAIQPPSPHPSTSTPTGKPTGKEENQ